MKATRCTPWLAAVMLGMAPAVHAAVLFQDDFSGAGGPLNGTTPDVSAGGEVWEAGDTFLDDGTANSPIADGPDGHAVHLNFTPESGKVYTAEATILNNLGNWMAFGFLPADSPVDDWTVQDFSVRHSNAPGYAWLLTRASSGNDQEGFLGAGTGGDQPWNGDIADPAEPIDFGIVLDTRAPTWTAEWFINGESQGAPAAFGAEGNPGIGGIGFSHERSADENVGAMISNFSLSVVPEPSAVVLALGAVAGLVGLYRHGGQST